MNIKELPLHPHVWGGEYWLHNTAAYCMKVLSFRAGTRGSRHYHTNKEETMLVVSGVFRISSAGGMRRLYRKGDFLTLTPGTPHQIQCIHTGLIVEASTFHDDADVTRLRS